MKSRIFRSIALVMLIIVTVILPIMSTGCGSTEKTLKIGLMTPATGVVAEKGLAGKNGLLDCVKYINEELGGVIDQNGAHYKIEAVFRDSEYTSTKVASSIDEFMDLGCLMFMTHSSTEMNYAKSKANEAGFPGLVTYASPTNYRPPEHIYAQTPDYGQDFATFAKYYMEHIWNQTGTETGKPKVVMLGLNNPTGQGARDGALAVADELGLDFAPDGSDYYEHAADSLYTTSTLLQIKDKNPDLIFISSTPAPSATIMKNLHEQEMYPKEGVTVAMAHASFTEQVISLVPDTAMVEGVYGVFPTATWKDNITAVNKAKEYVSSDFANSADYLSTWTAMIIIREILQNTLDNGVSYDTLAKGDAEAWQAIEEWGIHKLDYGVLGLQGAVKYTPGDNGLAKQLRVYQITSGNMTLLTGWIDVLNY